MSVPNGLLISPSLKLLPLHVLACLRSVSYIEMLEVKRSYLFVDVESTYLLYLFVYFQRPYLFVGLD
jgi:hypothetical protein